MADQMNQLEKHLDSIIKCLLDLEDRLREGQTAKRKFSRQKNEETAKRLVDRSKELVKACSDYLTLTDIKGNTTKAIK